MKPQDQDSNIGVKSRIRLDVVISGLILMATIAIQWANLRAEIGMIAHDQWTTKDQLQWSLQLKTLNPSINVPLPDYLKNGNDIGLINKSNTVMAASIKGQQ